MKAFFGARESVWFQTIFVQIKFLLFLSLREFVDFLYLIVQY